jgi:hypothetical protein
MITVKYSISFPWRTVDFELLNEQEIWWLCVLNIRVTKQVDAAVIPCPILVFRTYLVWILTSWTNILRFFTVLQYKSLRHKNLNVTQYKIKIKTPSFTSEKHNHLCL